MNTPSTGFQQYGEGLLNKFQSSKVGQMFGGKPRKKYDDDNSKESVRGGNKKDPKYTTVSQGKVERLKVGESESDVLATMYNFMSKNYKKDLDRMKKEKKHKKEIDDFEDLKNKQLIAALTGKKEKTKETKKGKGFGFGSLLKAGLAIGGLVLIEKAFAKMAETGKVADVADVLKTTKKEESSSSLPGAPPVKQNTPDTTPISSQDVSGKNPYATKEAKEAFDFFVGKGYTKEAAAGIVANLQAESGPHLNPKALGDDGKAKGIAQWQEARQKTFKEVVGKDVFDASRQEQLGHVDYELKNTHKKAGLAVNQQKTAGEAAAVVDKDYEQSKGLHRQKRMGIAEDLMRAFGGQNITETVVAGPTIIKEPSSKPTVSTPTKIKEPPQSEFNDLVKKGIIKPEFKSFADIREFEALVKAGVLDPKSMSHDELIKKYRQIQQSKKLKTTINPDVQERTTEEFNALVKKSIEEQNLKSQPKSMSELLKEQERKRLLNPESKNLVPDKKTSMMDRIKQLMSSNIIIIEKEKIVTEIAESNDTSILFNKIQQLS